MGRSVCTQEHKQFKCDAYQRLGQIRQGSILDSHGCGENQLSHSIFRFRARELQRKRRFCRRRRHRVCSNELDQLCRSVLQPHDFVQAVQPFFAWLVPKGSGISGPGSLQDRREWLALRLPVDCVKKFRCVLALVEICL
jgi:hypothetical protein